MWALRYPQFQFDFAAKSLPETEQIRLILPDLTAVGMGLSHASCALLSYGRGAAYGSVTRG
jgi:hypothetical protein